METGGFAFYTESDGKLAETERRKIEYLEARIDYSRPESILHVYNKVLQDQVFRTPVGLVFLKKLQDYLLKQPQIAPERVQPIPLFDTYTDAVEQRRQNERENIRERAAEQKKRANIRFQISVVLNILLVLAICAMFLISVQSEQPNIFNYERALVDRYAAWEQELEEREQAIRERERELDIDRLDTVQTTQ